MCLCSVSLLCLDCSLLSTDIAYFEIEFWLSSRLAQNVSRVSCGLRHWRINRVILQCLPATGCAQLTVELYTATWLYPCTLYHRGGAARGSSQSWTMYDRDDACICTTWVGDTYHGNAVVSDSKSNLQLICASIPAGLQSTTLAYFYRLLTALLFI